MPYDEQAGIELAVFPVQAAEFATAQAQHSIEQHKGPVTIVELSQNGQHLIRGEMYGLALVGEFAEDADARACSAFAAFAYVGSTA